MVLAATLTGHADPVNIAALNEEQILDLSRDHQQALRRDRHILSCPECHGAVHPRNCTSGLWMFAHNPGAARECSLAAGESVAHMALKALIFKAAQAAPGWTATVEQPLDGIDPVTKRPPVVDVFAARTGGARDDRGFEVQLSPMPEAVAENRHLVRASQLQCSWVTPVKPKWADRIPWHRIDVTEDVTKTLVVDGVVTRTPNPRGGDDYTRAEPFPERAMVRQWLSGEMRWVGTYGWMIYDGRPVLPKPKPVPKSNMKAAGRATVVCNRYANSPQPPAVPAQAVTHRAAKEPSRPRVDRRCVNCGADSAPRYVYCSDECSEASRASERAGRGK